MRTYTDSNGGTGVPQPTAAEFAVLGAHLIDHTLQPSLEPRMFSTSDFRDIYSCIVQLRADGRPVDVVTLNDALRKQERVDNPGEWVSALVDAVPTAANVAYHEDLVREAWTRRKVASMTTDGTGLDEIMDFIRVHNRAQRPEVLSWADMLAAPSLSFMVDDMLPSGGVSLLIGHPKAGKSTLARVLAAGVMGCGEQAFLGRSIRETGRVLYYSPDEHPSMTVQHFRGILPTDADGIDFVLRGDLNGLASVIDGHKLLIVDTMGRLFQGVRFHEGDSYFQWQAYLDRVREIATDTGCHVCLLHHARKSGGDRALAVLGSAAIAGAVDTVLSLTVAEEDGQHVRYVESSNRAGVDLPRQRLALFGDGWLRVEPLSFEATDPADEARTKARAMRADGVSVREIAKALGVSVGTAYNWSC